MSVGVGYRAREEIWAYVIAKVRYGGLVDDRLYFRALRLVNMI